MADDKKGFALQEEADANYYTRNKWQFDRHNGYGITHMLVKKDYQPPRQEH